MHIEFSLISIIATVIPLLHFLGLLSAAEALYYSRSSQGAIAWCLFLCTFPYVGLPLYWTLGRQKFRGYRERFARVAEHQRTNLAWYHTHVRAHTVTPADAEPHRLTTLTQIANTHFLGGNSAELLIDGDATFHAIFTAIDAANAYVLVEFFIIKDDDLGRLLKAKLLAAAQRGVRVFLLYDEVGSHSLPSAYCDELRAHGIQVSPFGTRKGVMNFFQVNFRNHRKIVVVDGQVAFIGGHNVGDEYMGRERRFGRWRDTHVRLSGPATLHAKAIFVSDWVWATGGVPDVAPLDPVPAGTLPVLTMGSGPADEKERCLMFFMHCINSARTRLWISSPYFVPDDGLLTALQVAALRGVDVRIILPKMRDHTLVWLASFFYVPAATAHGVKVYRYNDGFLHQKAIVVDDTISGIGTANFDNRSFRLNFEVTSIIADKDFTTRVAAMLEDDMQRCRDVSGELSSDYPLWKRVGSKFARLFSPVL